jgi:hypothetical protein
MSESIKARMPKIPDELTSRELRPLLEAMRTDIAALAASLNQFRTDYNATVAPTTAPAVTPTISE